MLGKSEETPLGKPLEEVLVLPTADAAGQGLRHASGWATYNVAARQSDACAVRAYAMRCADECAIYEEGPPPALFLACLSGSFHEWLAARARGDAATLVQLMTEAQMRGYPPQYTDISPRRKGRATRGAGK